MMHFDECLNVFVYIKQFDVTLFVFCFSLTVQTFFATTLNICLCKYVLHISVAVTVMIYHILSPAKIIVYSPTFRAFKMIKQH